MALSVAVPSSDIVGDVIQTIEMDCDAIAAVGDLVRQDLVDNNLVEIATDNQVERPIIGRIREKLTSTRCIVVLRGVIDVVGISRGKVYLGPSGFFNVGKPLAPCVLQILGYSFGNGKLHFEPNAVVTKIT